MASNSREARRRKILERGSDRLAFITGQINGVHPPPSSNPTSLTQPHLRASDSSPETIPPRDQIPTDRETGSRIVRTKVRFQLLVVLFFFSFTLHHRI